MCLWCHAALQRWMLYKPLSEQQRSLWTRTVLSKHALSQPCDPCYHILLWWSLKRMDSHVCSIYTVVSLHWKSVHAPWYFCIRPLQVSGGSMVRCDIVVIQLCMRELHVVWHYFLINVILLSNYCRFEHSILAKSEIQICWQSRGRGRAQRGPRPLAWYELGCIRFQLITRGAFRSHARPGLQAAASAADLSEIWFPARSLEV